MSQSAINQFIMISYPVLYASVGSMSPVMLLEVANIGDGETKIEWNTDAYATLIEEIHALLERSHDRISESGRLDITTPICQRLFELQINDLLTALRMIKAALAISKIAGASFEECHEIFQAIDNAASLHATIHETLLNKVNEAA